MDALVSFLTRRAKGGVARRDTRVEAVRLRFGRGTDCEVFLPDPRVLQAHAEITERPGGGFQIDALGEAELRVNGNPVRTAPLKPGDVVGLGPYEVAVIAPEGNAEIVLTVELVRPLSDLATALASRSRLGLREAGMSRRRLAWAAFLVVFALFFVAPFAAFFASPDTHGVTAGRDAAAAGIANTLLAAHSPGEMSGPHKFFGANCGACHQGAFTDIKDETCASCHAGVTHHAEPAVAAKLGIGEDCAGCHAEHKGAEPAAIRSEAFCADCHADLKARHPETTLENAGPFGKAHPQFRATVPTGEDGKLVRIALDATPEEHSNLKFPHEKHLKKEGVRVPGGPVRQMSCASCHEPDSGGRGMKPVAFEQNCAECHQNRFDPAYPEASLPHGDPALVMETLRGFYAARALAGGVRDADAPAVARRVPGSALPPGEETEARLAITQWAAVRADKAAHVAFSDKGCGACHAIDAPTADAPAKDAAGNLLVAAKASGKDWVVRKVDLRDSFLPKAAFDHAKHQTMECGTCHGAATSVKATDLLLPKAESCATCHGPEKAADKVPSTCVSCHGFHEKGQPPMAHPPGSAPGTAPPAQKAALLTKP